MSNAESGAMGVGKPGLPYGSYEWTAINGKRLGYIPPEVQHHCAGWLLYQHADGGWVTLRKATEDDMATMRRFLSWMPGFVAPFQDYPI